MSKSDRQAIAAPSKQGTAVAPCRCAHEFQDDRYGRGNRVHNLGRKSMKCTVCDRETYLPS